MGHRNGVGVPYTAYPLTQCTSRLFVRMEVIERQPVVGNLLATVRPCNCAEARGVEPGWDLGTAREEGGPVVGTRAVARARPVVRFVYFEPVLLVR